MISDVSIYVFVLVVIIALPMNKVADKVIVLRRIYVTIIERMSHLRGALLHTNEGYAAILGISLELDVTGEDAVGRIDIFSRGEIVV